MSFYVLTGQPRRYDLPLPKASYESFERTALTMPESENVIPEPRSRGSEASTGEAHMARARAKVDDVGADTNVSPLEHPPPGLPSDVAIGDWHDLLNAVKARLRLIVGEWLAATPEPHRHDTAGRFHASVLECVAALDQLHTTLTHELGRRQHLEREVLDAQTALAQARAELVGTQAEETRARHLALHDSLTSLPNRDFFRERLDHALAQAEPERQVLSLLYFDLDGFKPINDAHGHDAGDELLRIVAARLTGAVRAEDVVGRLGRDEFACLLGGLAGREQLNHLACKLFDVVSAPIQIGKLELSVRPSIGIAMCPAHGVTAEALLKSADSAMYHAKRHQTGYAFFDQCADVRAQEPE
jgi:diguanylate cyclase (GGDEF)-like protein